MDKVLEKIENGRQYRNIKEVFRALDTEDEKRMVEGYAATFNEPYVLYDWGDYVVREQIDPNAFADCDMSDVIFQYDHRGRVYARTRNNTLEVSTDEHGLKVNADLGGTETGRQLYEEIKGGYTDRMSFGFVVAEDKREVFHDHVTDHTEVMRTITKISKLYDVSAVSLPANDGTEISARSYCDGVIKELEAERRKRAETERAKAECLALLSL